MRLLTVAVKGFHDIETDQKLFRLVFSIAPDEFVKNNGVTLEVPMSEMSEHHITFGAGQNLSDLIRGLRNMADYLESK